MKSFLKKFNKKSKIIVLSFFALLSVYFCLYTFQRIKIRNQVLARAATYGEKAENIKILSQNLTFNKWKVLYTVEDNLIHSQIWSNSSGLIKTEQRPCFKAERDVNFAQLDSEAFKKWYKRSSPYVSWASDSSARLENLLDSESSSKKYFDMRPLLFR